jgi:hypothetical protein
MSGPTETLGSVEHVFQATTKCKCGFEPETGQDWSRHIQNVRIYALERLLDEMLRSFYVKGHPGFAAIRSGWIKVDRLAAWQEVRKG